MLSLKIEYQNGDLHHLSVEVPFVIGKQAPAALQLRGWRVAKEHAKLVCIAGDYFIHDLGSLTGTVVNGTRITEYGPLNQGDCIVIGPCQIDIVSIDQVQRTDSQTSMVQAVSTVEKEPHHESLAPSLYSTDKVGFLKKDDPYVGYIRTLHYQLVNALDLRRKNYSFEAVDSLREQAEHCLQGLIEADSTVAAGLCKSTLSERVLDEALGLGPLEVLLRDSTVSEIMVNSPSEVFVERAGLCEQSHLQFSSESALLAVIDRIVSPLGRRIDDSSPMVDARLADGSRVNAVVPPVALKGPTLTVRKFPKKPFSSADLLAHGAVSPAMLSFLQCCVEQKKNIVVSGGTGSGKTTLLNILTSFISAAERIITIEDAAELKLEQANLVTLEARPANLEGQGLISIRDLVRNALRMRPDRIVVGECRGGEAFDMLSAMNTGHEGSMTTLHANSPREAMNRLETLVMLAGMDLPLVVVRDHIAASIDIIVQQTRLSNGRRIISSITEICGQESGKILLQELFHAKELSSGGIEFKGNGLFPQNLSEQTLRADWFASAFQS